MKVFITKIILTSSIISILLLLFTVSGCRKNKDIPDPTPDLFDKSIMLENIGQNIILFNYSELLNATNNLETNFNSFQTNLTLNELNNLQTSFINAYGKYQNCSAFEFGPAETIAFRVSLNTFPTDTVQIIQNIQTGTYNLSAAENIDAKGFPALDYLLFGIAGNDSLILQKYKETNTGINNLNYLKELIIDLKLKITTVYNSWNPSSGNYINTFKNAIGSDVGASVSLLVNQLNFDLEIIKNPKLGIPLGKKTLGTLMPEKCEGFYAGNSIQLLKFNLTNLYKIYSGTSVNGTNGEGLDDYLEFLGTDYNGTKLHLAIDNQFNLTISKANELTDPFSQNLTAQNAKAEALYLEIQKLIVLLKNDLPSAIGIQITYQDSDGD